MHAAVSQQGLRMIQIRKENDEFESMEEIAP
jgi:hypothetical protein